MNDKHNLVTHVGDEVLETEVYQLYNIGDRVFTEPHINVVAIHRLLVGHCHSAAISLQSHFRFCFLH